LLYNKNNPSIEKKFSRSSLHVWTLNSYMNWVHVCGVQLSMEKEQVYKKLKWPEIQNEECLASWYDPQIKCQLFTFETDSPESMTVHALIHSEKQLSAAESENFVMQIRYMLVQQSLEQYWKEHDAWLQGLNSLTSNLDLNELLHNIMQNALIAITTVDRGFFTLYDPELQRLVPKAAIGMGESIYDFKTEIGEGIAGKVFRDKKGNIYNLEQVIEGISNIKEENYKNLMEAAGGPESIPPLMAVPVRMNKEKHGVMVVHQTKKNTRRLTSKDLRRLQGFADQAAIAISNARLFSELREKNEYLTKRNQIHEVFTNLSLKNADLVKIVQTVERLVGLPVFLFDLTKNEWYPRSSDQLLQLEDTILSEDLANGVETLSITVNQVDFHLYPIANEGFPIGYFTVELRRPLQPLDTVVLEQAGALVALKMVNTYSMTDMYYEKIYEFFNELLLYREPKLLMDQSKEYGLSPEKPFFVAVLQIKEKGDNIQKRETHMRQLIASLNKALKQSNHLLFGFQDKVTMIIHAENVASRENIIRKIKTGGSLWKNDRSTVLRGGMGRFYTGLEYIAKSAEEANKSLSYLLNRDISGILQYEKIGINRLFLNQDPKDIEQFIQEVLSPLQSPKAKAGNLELTLKTYIDTNRSVSMTADRLHIHSNTLYHRLRKIEDALQVDLNDPEDWLTVLLACYLSESY
jgi:hypothetical protein